MLKYDVKRAFSKRLFCFYPVMLMGIAFIIGFDSIIEISEKTGELKEGWTMEFVMKVLQHEGIQFVLPIFAVLPFSAGFVEERKSGMIKNITGRIRKKKYLCSKVFTTACAGGTTLVMGALLFLAISCLLFCPLELKGSDTELIQSLRMDYVKLLLRYFLNGALWAEVGLMMSAWINYPLMAWLSPFMIYYLLIIFYERYLPWYHVMYPREWIVVEQQWPFEPWSLYFWLLFLIVIAGYAFYRIGERILQNV